MRIGNIDPMNAKELSEDYFKSVQRPDVVVMLHSFRNNHILQHGINRLFTPKGRCK